MATTNETTGRMTVAELIEALRGYPPDALVVMAKDAEGNGFSILYGTGLGSWLPWGGAGDAAYGTFTTAETPAGTRVAVCLVPA